MHEVEPTAPTAIPPGKVIIVVDVGDSILAPHQSMNKTYYYRAGSHSLAAPHFYLETLRNRLVTPVLEPMLTYAEYITVGRENDAYVLSLQLKFKVMNVGRVAAYKWALVVELNGHCEAFEDNHRHLPKDNLRLDSTILPSLFMSETCSLGVVLRPESLTTGSIQRDFDRVLPSDLLVRYRAVTETSPGEYVETRFHDVLDRRDTIGRLTLAILGS